MFVQSIQLPADFKADSAVNHSEQVDDEADIDLQGIGFAFFLQIPEITLQPFSIVSESGNPVGGEGGSIEFGVGPGTAPLLLGKLLENSQAGQDDGNPNTNIELERQKHVEEPLLRSNGLESRQAQTRLTLQESPGTKITQQAASAIRQHVAEGNRSDGTWSISVRVTPRELGAMDIKVQMQHDQITVHIVATERHSAELLTHERSQLVDSLVAFGFENVDVEVACDSGGQGNWFAEQQECPKETLEEESPFESILALPAGGVPYDAGLNLVV